MDTKRLILYALLVGILITLWQAWQKDYGAQPAPSGSVAEQTIPTGGQSLSQQAAIPAAVSAPASAAIQSQLIKVQTDLMQVMIDTQGGNIVELNLLKFPAEVGSSTPVQLLRNNPDNPYIAQSGLIGAQGPDAQNNQAQFTAAQTSYQLQPGQNQLNVVLTWQNAQGVTVTKTFTFLRGQYPVKVNYQVDNRGTQPWSGQLYAQLRQKPPVNNNSIFSLHTFNGAAVSTAHEPYEKFTFSKLIEENIDRSTPGGWLAMQQRYFLSVWIPEPNQNQHYYSRTDNNHIVTLGVIGPVLQVAPNSSTSTEATFYGGPEIPDYLRALAPHLDLTINYGWLWPISQAIFWIMKHLYHWIGNWGWAIILVTVLIKLLFYKLSETSYRSMAKLRKLAPKLEAIKDRYGEDRQKLGKATMELYRKEKANPLSGCLPMLIQIPFFIALYYVLVESVAFRQAPFIGWIRDLSVHDPYYILPILMGITMWIQQRLTPTPSADPMQARIMMLLPIFFTVFFLAFPAGLVLYWLVNSCLSVLQQWWVIRQMDRKSK
ncbi:MAG: membrane protein insertase YidC [Gammaproteobacteria bacterium]